LKLKGVDVYALAIGSNTDLRALSEMSSGDGFLFKVRNFNGLSGKLQDIVQDLCEYMFYNLDDVDVQCCDGSLMQGVWDFYLFSQVK
jgi:hypothetical protein